MFTLVFPEDEMPGLRLPPPSRSVAAWIPGHDIVPTTVWHVLSEVRRETEIEGFHVHQMRLTFASQWIERGGSLAALQQILGHASVVTTQRYAKLCDDAVRREAERLTKLGQG